MRLAGASGSTPTAYGQKLHRPAGSTALFARLDAGLRLLRLRGAPGFQAGEPFKNALPPKPQPASIAVAKPHGTELARMLIDPRTLDCQPRRDLDSSEQTLSRETLTEQLDDPDGDCLHHLLQRGRCQAVDHGASSRRSRERGD